LLNETAHQVTEDHLLIPSKIEKFHFRQ
jgi:hypothetical protein